MVLKPFDHTMYVGHLSDIAKNLVLCMFKVQWLWLNSGLALSFVVVCYDVLIQNIYFTSTFMLALNVTVTSNTTLSHFEVYSKLFKPGMIRKGNWQAKISVLLVVLSVLFPAMLEYIPPSFWQTFGLMECRCAYVCVYIHTYVHT